MNVLRLQDDVDLLRLHEFNSQRYPFLLESTGENPRIGRFDILFCCPGESLALTGTNLEGPHANQGNFLAALNSWYEAESLAPANEAEVPFGGGWFLYLGYELLAEIEPSVKVFEDPLLPVAFAVRCPVAVVRDRRQGTAVLTYEHGSEQAADQVRRDFSEVAGRGTAQPGEVISEEIIEEPGEAYLEQVRAAKHYIREGDIFQANLSRAWTARLRADTRVADVYAALRRENPAPFSGLCSREGVTIISSSPERLLASRQGRVQTRPIAGTRKRSEIEIEDGTLSAELMAHPKERAEHVMLVDLERNDLGRISRTGTVTVDEFMVLESYAHVHHIVSNVSGELMDSVLPGDIIRAVFPGGTITGCPKVRCMEIISQLEKQPRGAYTGSMGYLGIDGCMDLNILIRTMVHRDDTIGFRAGAGIVADSDPEQELLETRAKARGMLKALE